MEKPVVSLTFRDFNGMKVVDARISSIEPRIDEKGEPFDYVGYAPLDWRHGQWGYTRRYSPPHAFGLQSIEVKG